MFDFEEYKGIEDLIYRIPEKGLDVEDMDYDFHLLLHVFFSADDINDALSDQSLQRHEAIGFLAALGNKFDYQTLAKQIDVDPDDLKINELHVGAMTETMEKWGLDASNLDELCMIEGLTKLDRAFRHPKFGEKLQVDLDPSLKANFTSEVNPTLETDTARPISQVDTTISEEINMIFKGVLNIAARFIEELPPSPLKSLFEDNDDPTPPSNTFS